MAAPIDSIELDSLDQADVEDNDKGIFIDVDDGNQIKKDSLRSISRIQGTAPTYDAAKEYNINDLVTEGNVTYINIVAITTPETFDPAKWSSLEGLQILADQTLAVQSDDFDILFVARKYLHVIIFLEGIGGNLNAEFTFNDDSGTNYAFNREENMATLANETNADRVPLDPSTIDINLKVILDIFNQAGTVTSFMGDSVAVDGASAATLPATQRVKGNWHDNAQVIKLNLHTTINEFTTNSRVIVLGSKN